MFNINLDKGNSHQNSLGEQKRWTYCVRKTGREMNIFWQTIHLLLSPCNVENLNTTNLNKLGFENKISYNNRNQVYNIIVSNPVNKRYEWGILLNEKCVASWSSMNYNFEVFELKYNNSLRKIGGKNNLVSHRSGNSEYPSVHFIPFSADAWSYILFRVTFSESSSAFSFSSYTAVNSDYCCFIEFLPA